MKTRFVMLVIVLLFSLTLTSSVSASKSPPPPTWEVAFDSGEVLGPDAESYQGVVFKNTMYWAYFNLGENPDQAWGTRDGRHWFMAWDANMIQADLEYLGPMTAFKDQLYVVAGDWDGVYPEQIFRTRDGKHWEPVLAAETGENIYSWLIMFTTFKGELYAVFAYENDGVVTNHLWRSSSGDPGTWEDVAQFPWNAAAFAEFKGALYTASDWYGGGPTQVWRSSDGMIWEPVVTDGFNSGNINTGGFGRQGGYLYIGTGNFDGSEIWRTKDGVRWEMIAQKGLDDPNNLGFIFVNYGNLLYTFTYNEISGCKAYISKDGIIWMPANEPGWGDPANIAVLRDGARVIFKGKLYASPLGPLGIITQSRP